MAVQIIKIYSWANILSTCNTSIESRSSIRFFYVCEWCFIIAVGDDIVADPLEKLMESKSVKEKKIELEKKLESLRRKHEKVY